MKHAVVEIRDLAFAWPGHEAVLDLPALRIHEGERVFIKGPSGCGKSTVARRLAAYYGLPVLDTGAIYRALALVARERGVAWTDLDGWHRLDQHEISLGEPHGRARVKVVPREDMVAISRAE